MEKIITLLNHWWRQGKVKPELAKEYKRESFEVLKSLSQKKQIIVISGLRRVGKSTLMYQTIDDLLKKGVYPLRILYFSFDKQVASIQEVLDVYSKITSQDYEKEKLFCFFDEIYKLENWHRELKLLYDALPNIKFFVSGSASLEIEKKARNNLTGRAFYLSVLPLSFKEFFEIKQGQKIKDWKVWQSKLISSFEDFLTKPFPEIINFNKEDTAEYIKELVLDKIIFSDFAKVFDGADVVLLQTLTEIFFSQPGLYLNVESLSRDLKKSKKDIIFHIKLLELGYIIRIIKNYRGSAVVASRKLRRVYPYHPSLTQGLYKDIEVSKLVEAFVRLYLDAQYYWRSQDKEVDFIYQGFPVEVKYRNEIKGDDYKNVIKFMEKFKKNKGYLISKNTTKQIKLKSGGSIQTIPVWQVALNGLKL